MNLERDYILGILGAAPVPSRTMLQKLVYLLGAIRDEPVPYTPHFFGPFSRAVQAEVDRLVAAEIIDEQASVYESWEPSGFDVVGYTYELTDLGHLLAREVEIAVRDQAAEVVRATQEMGAWSQAALSMAAKLHHLRTTTTELDAEAVGDLATRFGWRMTPQDAARGAELLDRLLP